MRRDGSALSTYYVPICYVSICYITRMGRVLFDYPDIFSAEIVQFFNAFKSELALTSLLFNTRIKSFKS